MNEMGIAIVAACVATGMALLVRTGVNPGLRAAIRTTVILAIAWSLAYQAERPLSLAAMSWRGWAMLALSTLAIGIAWGLNFRSPKAIDPVSGALADKINVVIAAAFALLLLFGPSPQRYGISALLLVAGALILARNHQ